MSFASLDFAMYFIIILIGTYLIQKFGGNKVKEFFLLAASYFFYGYWDWRFCFLLLFVTVVSYFTAFAHHQFIYYFGVFVPLIILGIFKYFNFFLDSITKITGSEFSELNIILPVGISFYTFQALSYVIDVHRKKVALEKDFIKLALYLSFFPQLVAGPIIKAKDFLPQLYENRQITIKNLKCGIQIFAYGMFKKIVLADHISVFVDDVYSTPAAFHWGTIFLAVVSYSLQIYLDFSGYSDMAIGCAKCLGYEFQCNFNLPYISQSVTEFWHRWHISLSTWLKEYLYIPLGGNRKGKIRQYLNLFLTMLLGGLWHGANWTFVFWGGLNGLALCIDKLLPDKQREHVILKGVRVIVTFLFISFTWIFFRADNFSVAWEIIRGLFILQDGIIQPFVWSFVGIVLLIVSHGGMVIQSLKNNKKCINNFYPVMSLESIWERIVFFVFIGFILGWAFTGEHPFVYFQF